MRFTKFLQKLIMDNGNGPPACDSQKGPDGKLKSNLEWPNMTYLLLLLTPLLVYF